MKKCLENKAAGFYLSALATGLSAVGTLFYSRSMYKETMVYILLAAGIGIFLAATGLSAVLGDKKIFRSVTLVNAVLLAAVLVESLSPMVNQIGFVFSGLDPMSTISGFLGFAVICFVGMVLNIAASYLRYTK